MKGNRLFWHAFHGRGMTVEKLAGQIQSARCHVTQVLNGTRSGIPTRRRLIKANLLTEKEIILLGWDVPPATKCHVEHLKLLRAR